MFSQEKIKSMYDYLSHAAIGYFVAAHSFSLPGLIAFRNVNTTTQWELQSTSTEVCSLHEK